MGGYYMRLAAWGLEGIYIIGYLNFARLALFPF